MRYLPFLFAASVVLSTGSAAFAGGWEPPSQLPKTPTPAAIVANGDNEFTILIGSGGRGGMYYPAAEVIDAFIPPGFDVDAVVTGGTWANVSLALSGKVHAFVAQPDGMTNVSRLYPDLDGDFLKIGDLHREYSLILCNRQKVKFDEASGNLESTDVRLAIAGRDSGANLLFGNWIAEDSGYERTQVVYFDSSQMALTSVRSGQNHCTLMASGLSSPAVQEIDRADSRQLWLIHADDGDFNDALDMDDKKLYEFFDIPEETFIGLSADEDGDRRDVETTTWHAGVYAYLPAFEGEDGQKALSALTKSMKLAGPAVRAAEAAAIAED